MAIQTEGKTNPNRKVGQSNREAGQIQTKRRTKPNREAGQIQTERQDKFRQGGRTNSNKE
jgi:hypothetical protein